MTTGTPTTPGDPTVVVVGAGISGLATAYELQQRGVSVRILDTRDRPGGVILTDRLDGFVIDGGPDSLLAMKPAAIELCRELGLGERLFPTREPRTAFIYRSGRLHPIPEASVLGFPTRLRALAASSLFTVAGRLRMGLEVLTRPRPESADESIAAFVGRHFGREAVDYVAEPLLAGIHAGDVDRLSIQAAFPRLVEAERRYGSLIRAFAAARRQTSVPASRPSQGAFRSLPGGIGELVGALVGRLGPGILGCRTAVDRVQLSPEEPGDEPAVRVYCQSGTVLAPGAVVLAMPAWATASLVRPFDAELASLCERIHYWSTATVALGYPREAVPHPMQGSGFVVPRKAGLTITAGSWVSSKWPMRAPDTHVLLRAFLGGARDPGAVDRSDGTLIDAAIRDFGTIMAIRGAPTLARVYRWPRASPQQAVGHRNLMEAIDARLARWPRLFVTGTGLRGVGIPDCVADGRATGRAVAALVGTGVPSGA